MFDLNNSIWKTFKSAYRINYNASIKLKELEKAEDEKVIEEIFQELWEELHHQGDVDLASYFSLPHLIRIGIENSFNTYHIPALVAVIEIQRHGNNPKIPEEFKEDYKNEIKNITELMKRNQSEKWDENYATSALSAMAAVNGQIDLAKMILELDEFNGKEIAPI